jgi:hypothetical protein
MQPLLVFIHVPKTAGTTAIRVLRELWPPGRSWPRGGNKAVQAMARTPAPPWRDPAFWQGVDLVYGHLPFGHDVLRSITGRDVVFAGIMRDPVARAVSAYDFMRRRADHHRHAILCGMEFIDAVEGDPWFRDYVTCGQLRYLFGGTTLEEVRAAMRTRRYLIGRTDALPDFLGAVAALAGRGGELPPIPRVNDAGSAEPLLPPARSQPGIAAAERLLRSINRPEIAFLRRIQPVLRSGAW